MILEVVEAILLVVLGFFLLYLAMLSLLALAAKRNLSFPASRLRRLAIVVPAHNEEFAIGKTLRSFSTIDYPKELFDVVVVADNCHDNTARIAHSYGATVFERFNPNLQGKGHALRWVFEKLLDQTPSYDAMVVVDADSTVSSNLLTVLNFYLERGNKVIQVADLVRPFPGAWSPEVTRLAFTLYNYVRPLGRKVFGCSAGLRGNGMCFSAETLRAHPWQAFSLTEDLEYGLILLLQGISVVFAPEAQVLAAMPQHSKDALTQRTRWEAGRLPVIKRYTGRLLARALRRLSFNAFDAVVDLLTPPLVNLLIVVFAFTSVHAIVLALDVQGTSRYLWWWLMLIALGLVHVFVGLLAARAHRSLYKALFYVPRYAVWKLLLYLKIINNG
ncbi:MAG: glycosyltransferase family 2 protein, partial [Bacteroidota bacterium]